MPKPRRAAAEETSWWDELFRAPDDAPLDWQSETFDTRGLIRRHFGTTPFAPGPQTSLGESTSVLAQTRRNFANGLESAPAADSAAPIAAAARFGHALAARATPLGANTGPVRRKNQNHVAAHANAATDSRTTVADQDGLAVSAPNSLVAAAVQSARILAGADPRILGPLAQTLVPFAKEILAKFRG